MIERYTEDWSGVIDDPDGDYVYYSDYEILSKKYKELKKENRRLKDENERLNKQSYMQRMYNARNAQR